MTERYYSETPISGDRALLTGDEAHHLMNVMRARVGDEVVLFDGLGAEFSARIEQLAKREVRLAVTSRAETNREAPRRVTLYCALPRGDRQRWLVEKAVEMGVTKFVPLRTARGVVQPDAGVCERLRRTVVEASKQCRRNVLMEIGDPCGVPPAGESLSHDVCRLLAHPGAEATLVDETAPGRLPPGAAVAILIGPEGGFTDDEARAAQAAGWQAVDLGARILRIETAALLAAALTTAR